MKALTESQLAELLREAWNDGLQVGNPQVEVFGYVECQREEKVQELVEKA